MGLGFASQLYITYVLHILDVKLPHHFDVNQVRTVIHVVVFLLLIEEKSHALLAFTAIGRLVLRVSMAAHCPSSNLLISSVHPAQ